VLPAIGAAVTGIVHHLAPLRRIRIGDDVMVLEIVGGGADRQVVDDIQLLAGDAVHLAQEVHLVPLADLAAEVERYFGLLELVVGTAEGARGVDRHLRGGKLAQLVPDGPEVGLDLPRLAFAGGGKLVVDRVLQRIARPHVAQHSRDQHGDRAQQQQDRKQPCRQSPSHGTGGSGARS